MIELRCMAPTALLPALRPGDSYRICLVDGRPEIHAPATPLMLTILMAALAAGELADETPAQSVLTERAG